MKRSNQTLYLMFWIKTAKATKDGRAPIYVRLTIDGAEEEMSTGCKINPVFWDTTEKRNTEETEVAEETNKTIKELKEDLEAHFKVLSRNHECITPLMLKNDYLGLPLAFRPGNKGANIIVAEPEKPRTLIDSYDEFIKLFEKKVDKKLRSDGTLRHWNTAKRKIEEFLGFQYESKDINVVAIKYSFAEKFYDYMTLEMEEPVAEITARGHIKKLKQILKGCVSHEYLTKNPIASFICAGGEKDVEPLEMEQVQRIYRKELTIPRLDEVRDCYIFQCFTGFAYQDVYALSTENIVLVGKNSERWLIKDRGKTGVSEMVPILPIVEEILEKYRNHPYCIKNNCLLPVNSNVRYNGYLKEIADICGLPTAGLAGTDNFYFSDVNFTAAPEADRNLYVWNKQVWVNGASLDWTYSYRNIAYANIVLDGMVKLSPTTNNYNNVMGQAKFWRAFSYYNLAQIFCKPYDGETANTDLGLPLRTTADINIIYQPTTGLLYRAYETLPDQ